jgi:hypothetical protein
LVGVLGACRLSGLVWDTACRGEGSIVAPGAWKGPAGVARAARRGLGVLPGASGAKLVAAAGVPAAAIRRWCCGLRSAAGREAAG